MKTLILTGHHPRHIFMSKKLAEVSDRTLVISATMGLNPAKVGDHGEPSNKTIEWFEERFEAEKNYFNHRSYNLKNLEILPVRPEEVNSEYVYEVLQNFQPDIIVVYGTGIIKGRILNYTKKIINIHLGISPYYNGAGTNWWPMYNEEFEFIGTTIHYLDAGVDTGDILGQTRAKISKLDSPHDIGNKNIVSASVLVTEIVKKLKKDILQGINQSLLPARRTLKMKEFNSEKITDFTNRIENGLIKNWLYKKYFQDFQMVDFNNGKPKIISSLNSELKKII